jgi:tripartite-type tricarboxylate transporter receptor subunit TctC
VKNYLPRRLVGNTLLKALGVASLLAATMITPAHAQPYPNKTIKFIVPFTAGSGTDIVARAVAETMSKNMGQPIIVENKPGAGGTIAASGVAKAEPDGYSILIHSSGHAVNPAIYPNLNYDTLKDLSGVTPLAALANVMVVPPAKGWKTVGDVVAAAKAAPGKMNYASAGSGSATHINAEKFRIQAGLDAVHIPFKGTPEAITEIIGGRLDWFFAPIVSALPMIKEGRLQALAVSTPKRASSLPNVPTTIEAGVAASDYIFWVGMIVSSKTPRDIVKRLNDEAIKALNTPEVKERLAKAGAETFSQTPEQFDAFIKAEVESIQKIATSANLKP